MIQLQVLFEKIKRLFDWLPVIWNDNDFDYSYLDKIILFKLKRMYKLSRSNDESKKSLRICINILERIKDDWYFETYKYLINVDKGDINKMFVRIPGTDTYELNKEWMISNNMELYIKKSKQANEVKDRDWKIYNKLYYKYKEEWWF
jgi:hypothetical protein